MSIYKELDYTSNVEQVTGLQFGIFSPDEIEKQSVAEITKQETYINNEPVLGGLFDPRMGVLDHGKRCKSCEQFNYFCPGHFGHIVMARPVFYIHFLAIVLKVLKCVCISCSSLLINKEGLNIEDLLKKNGKQRWADICQTCQNCKRCGESSQTGCGAKQPTRYIKEGISKIIAEWKNEGDAESKRLHLTASHIQKIFKRISDEDVNIMGFSPNWCRPDWMICSILLVPPPQVRPTVQQDNNQRMDDDMTHKLVDIIKANKIIKTKLEAGNINPQIIDDWTQVLQYHVATFIDNEIPGIPAAQQRSGRPLKSVRQRLKAKEGRVRGNLMGKRVDYSARSVITPDPNITINQLGVPFQIAMNLTFPESVTKYNIHKMYKYVKNGPDKHPGANSIKRVNENTTISLSYVELDKIKLNIGDIINRHLIDDDVVLFNRQPSLHKMSMMAHTVKVMPYSTFRLNVSVTSPYNADFDGDEMNMHAPQSIQSRYEIQKLACVSSQIISPRENKPVISIVQDSLLGANRITRDCVKFSEKILMDLLMWNKDFDGILPKPLNDNLDNPKWSGHQLISMILPEITLNMGNKSFDEENENYDSQNFIKIKNGIMSQGKIDKDILTKSSRGIIQILFNDYGQKESTDFLDNIQYIITNYLVRTGFSCGISDLIATQYTKDKMKKEMENEIDEVKVKMQHVHLNIFDNQSSKTNTELFEEEVNNILNRASRKAGTICEKSLSKDNRIVNMVKAGSKGSTLNITQMVACLGQQNIDGKRIPYGFVDRTLPHYTKYNDGAESRGFVESSFIKGLKPQEFFFHAMGGREGLIDTAVKTSETGYIQRKLIKAMEDLSVKYDGTVRNAANTIVQFVYGEDGMESTKVESQFMESVRMNSDELFEKIVFNQKDNLNLYLDQDIVDNINHNNVHFNQIMEKHFNEILNDKKTIIEKIHENVINPLIYYPINMKRLIITTSNKFEINKHNLTDLSPFYILEKIDEMMNDLYININNKSTTIFGILLRYNLSPKILIKDLRITKECFDYIVNNIYIKFKRSIVEPGEMVGAIAAQSIGEPATQMTLNTFHFAGVGEKSNVTRGVPRLKELLSISKNQKNPSLRVALNKDIAYDKEKAKTFMDKLEYTSLKDITIKTRIYYDPVESETIISEDREILDLYQEFQDLDENNDDCKQHSPWLLRLEFDRKVMMNKDITMFDIYSRLCSIYDKTINCIFTDDNSSNLILRIRIKDAVQDKNTSCDDSSLLKTLETNMLDKIILRGINNINKVSFSQKKDLACLENGEYVEKQPWQIDTDGINLVEVMNLPEVDAANTFSNDIHEIYETLGIEAARYALIKEITEVISYEGAYVNYRHIALLCDVMTVKGGLMSIDRHGINRGDIGPLAKSSFEETTDQLIKASIFGECDKINGVSANIMMGQLAPCGTGVSNILFDENAYDDYDDDEDLESDEEIDSDEDFELDDCDDSMIAMDYNIPVSDVNPYNLKCDNDMTIE